MRVAINCLAWIIAALHGFELEGAGWKRLKPNTFLNLLRWLSGQGINCLWVTKSFWSGSSASNHSSIQKTGEFLI